MLKIAKAKRNNLPFILQSLHPIDIFEHMLCANHWAYKDKYIFLCEELIICWRSQRVKERNCRKLCTLLSCCCSVSKLCPTLCNPMDCSPPGSSVHGILQARILEWVAVPFSRWSSQPRSHALQVGSWRKLNPEGNEMQNVKYLSTEV